MRFFELLNTQQVLALIILTVIFAILFGVTLWVLPMSGPKSRVSNNKAVQQFADGIEKANGPFPMIIALIIGGTVLWAIYYILFYGLSEVIL
jgi:ABC-type methionine transport system permease subunit